ncbi:MAG: HAD family phosphatase [Oscillospiraceae bacterium]|nr:HAD family phosphatase [Oscillospiraceae bacterium]
MIRALIFDFDGTLLDSMYAWKSLGAEYLAHKGIREIPPELEDTLKPLSLLDAAKYFIAAFAFAQTPEEIVAEFNALAAEKYRSVFLPKPGAAKCLERHRDMRMCVATAADRTLVEMAVERLGWGRYFQFILTSGEVGGSKRSPGIFLRAAERLGVAIAEAAVFEDSPHAIKSAKSAGFYTVGVHDAFYAAEAGQIRAMADLYVNTLDEFEVTLCEKR